MGSFQTVVVCYSVYLSAFFSVAAVYSMARAWVTGRMVIFSTEAKQWKK